MQFDARIAEMRELLDKAKLAAVKAGQTADFTDMEDILASVEKLREDDMEDATNTLDNVLGLANTIAMAIGGVLMAVAIIGALGTILLVWKFSSSTYTLLWRSSLNRDSGGGCECRIKCDLPIPCK
jgi:hypothetical protein